MKEAAVIDGIRRLDYATATLHEASGQQGALPSQIKPLNPTWKLLGRALSVVTSGGDNLWLHKALATAKPGTILVVDTGGVFEHGYWGDIMTHAAMARGLAGLVIDGCVRDGEVLSGLEFPVFARGLCIRGTAKDPHGSGVIGNPICIGDVPVQSGDWVVGDRDGVVVIPNGNIEATLQRAHERERHEMEVRERLKQGHTTMDIYGWAEPDEG
ncbi:RraA family protein [Alicyclobacillus sp. ALC3]|uniref:RraA family protein n=1 Tax=Alicyclobacillus sp. ALC3 TaxID=2796143 RepID=UPI002379CB38|nr:RraA family protein [Alicyclobacillus sp. ALC3]WDL97742.1 RraA family protein [Alicyclobacillus sp. ALC3]